MHSRFIKMSCKRCGKPITTLRRSIHGIDSVFLKWQGICCLTAEEQSQMLHEQAQAIVKKFQHEQHK